MFKHSPGFKLNTHIELCFTLLTLCCHELCLDWNWCSREEETLERKILKKALKGKGLKNGWEEGQGKERDKKNNNSLPSNVYMNKCTNDAGRKKFCSALMLWDWDSASSDWRKTPLKPYLMFVLQRSKKEIPSKLLYLF